MSFPRLYTQQEALHHYLDSLLAEIPTAPEAEGETAAETVATGLEDRGAHEETISPDTSAPPCPPAWTQAPFKVLVFQSGGVQMAAPLVQLGGVVKEAALARLPHMPPWSRGVLQHRGRQVPVVDIPALQALADGLSIPPKAGRAACYILLAEGRCALACDEVAEMVTVEPGEVRWRRGRGRRPWCGGIITTRMCVLLDVEALCGMLG